MERLDKIADTPGMFDFFHVARRLEAGNAAKPKIGDSATLRDDYVSFGQDPYLNFPDSNLSRAERKESGRLSVMVRFLGLTGPQGALPLATTQEAYDYLRANDDALARFFDLFNNRFIQLFFRAWGESRPLVHRDRPAEDRFDHYAGSAIGLGSPALRGLDSVRDLAKISYAGLIAPKVKSASRLKGFIAGLFGLKVEVEEFVGSRLLFDPDQRSRLGKGFATLGKDVLVGAGVYSVQDKFRLRLFARDLAEYREFLPSGSKSKSLADLVFFYVGAEIDWDVELALPVGETAPVRLGQSGQLGWTSWMAPNWAEEKGALRTDARFDLSKRHKRA